ELVADFDAGIRAGAAGGAAAGCAVVAAVISAGRTRLGSADGAAIQSIAGAADEAAPETVVESAPVIAAESTAVAVAVSAAAAVAVSAPIVEALALAGRAKTIHRADLARVGGRSLQQGDRRQGGDPRRAASHRITGSLGTHVTSPSISRSPTGEAMRMPIGSSRSGTRSVATGRKCEPEWVKGASVPPEIRTACFACPDQGIG